MVGKVSFENNFKSFLHNRHFFTKILLKKSKGRKKEQKIERVERLLDESLNNPTKLALQPIVMDRVPEIGFSGSQNWPKNGFMASFAKFSHFDQRGSYTNLLRWS